MYFKGGLFPLPMPFEHWVLSQGLRKEERARSLQKNVDFAAVPILRGMAQWQQIRFTGLAQLTKVFTHLKHFKHVNKMLVSGDTAKSKQNLCARCRWATGRLSMPFFQWWHWAQTQSSELQALHLPSVSADTTQRQHVNVPRHCPDQAVHPRSQRIDPFKGSPECSLQMDAYCFNYTGLRGCSMQTTAKGLSEPRKNMAHPQNFSSPFNRL